MRSQLAALMAVSLVLTEIIGQADSSTFVNTCISGWNLVNDTICLKMIPKTTWYSANQACMDEGGQLFDAGGRDWLVSATAQFLAKEYFWVNAAKISVNYQRKVWSFMDGTPMTYFNWKKGEPNNDNGIEDYIVWRMSDGGVWNDEQDTKDRSFTRDKTYGVVCQDIPVHVISWVAIGRQRYTLIDKPEATAGVEAEKLCKLYGGTLAKITDPDLMEAIFNVAKSKGLAGQDYWIAGKNQVVNGIAGAGDYPYWLKTKKLVSSSYKSINGQGVAMTIHTAADGSIVYGYDDPIKWRRSICLREADKVEKSTTQQSSTTEASTTGDSKTLEISNAEVKTTTSPKSSSYASVSFVQTLSTTLRDIISTYSDAESTSNSFPTATKELVLTTSTSSASTTSAIYSNSSGVTDSVDFQTTTSSAISSPVTSAGQTSIKTSTSVLTDTTIIPSESSTKTMSTMSQTTSTGDKSTYHVQPDLPTTVIDNNTTTFAMLTDPTNSQPTVENISISNQSNTAKDTRTDTMSTTETILMSTPDNSVFESTPRKEKSTALIINSSATITTTNTIIASTPDNSVLESVPTVDAFTSTEMTTAMITNNSVTSVGTSIGHTQRPDQTSTFSRVQQNPTMRKTKTTYNSDPHTNSSSPTTSTSINKDLSSIAKSSIATTSAFDLTTGSGLELVKPSYSPPSKGTEMVNNSVTVNKSVSTSHTSFQVHNTTSTTSSSKFSKELTSMTQSSTVTQSESTSAKNVGIDNGLNVNIDNSLNNNNVNSDADTETRGEDQSSPAASSILSDIFPPGMIREFRKPAAIAGLVVGGVCFLLLVVGMMLAVVYRKRSNSSAEESSAVASDFEMLKYNTRNKSDQTLNYMEKLFAYNPIMPRINMKSVTVHNNNGYEYYADDD